MTRPVELPDWLGRWRAYVDRLAVASGPVRTRGSLRDLEIAKGLMQGAVRTSRGPVEHPRASWPVAPEDVWERAIDALASQLRHRAALAERMVPDPLADELDAAGISLVPGDGELQLSCSCPHTNMPCGHVVVLLEAVLARVQRSPSLALALRGRTVDQIAGRLATRAGAVAPRAATFDLGLPLGRERGDLDQIVIQPRMVDDPTALIRQLGALPSVPSTDPLERLVRRAADDAWSLAIGAGVHAADRTTVLTELRRQRFATAPAVARAVGWPDDRVRLVLDELFDQGEVLRTGAGDDARYRAAPG